MKNKILFFLAFCFAGCASTANQACYGDKCFNIEVARTEKERAKGLQFRSHLAEDHGMLFVFADENQPQKFWMKDTKIPLDMIWMDKNGQVIDILAYVQPCKSSPCPTYGPDEPAAYVLEFNAGTAEDLGIQEKPGEKFVFKTSKKLSLDR